MELNIIMLLKTVKVLLNQYHSKTLFCFKITVFFRMSKLQTHFKIQRKQCEYANFIENL